MRCILIILLYH